MKFSEALAKISKDKAAPCVFDQIEEMLIHGEIDRGVYLDLVYRFIDVDLCAGSDDCTIAEGVL